VYPDLTFGANKSFVASVWIREGKEGPVVDARNMHRTKVVNPRLKRLESPRRGRGLPVFGAEQPGGNWRVGKVRGMKRLILALAIVGPACGALYVSGCVGHGAAGSIYEIIPGVPFPAQYSVAITPTGMTAPLATEHILQIVAPAAGSGHAFEVAIEPVSTVDVLGAVELMTARAPGSPPMLSGTTVRVNVVSDAYASPVQFRGLTGYEVSGTVPASSGWLEMTFRTSAATGNQTVSGRFELTTADPEVPPALRTYTGTFAGEYQPSGTPGGGPGGGPPGPPFP
jgi:hypothetical protein